MADHTITATSPTTLPRRNRGEGHLFQRGRFWWIQYSHHRRLHRESSRSTNRTVAERKLRRRLAEIHVGEFIGPKAERIRYEELAAELVNYYLTTGKKSLVRPKKAGAKPYVGGQLHLDKFFKGYRAVDITTDRIREYVRARQAKGAANATINRSLAALKTMFHLAVKARKLREVPYFEKLEERNVRKGFLEHDQYLRLRAALPDYLTPVLAMGYYTGMRRGEIRGLRWEQVSLLDRQARLDPGTTKNDEGRIVPLADELVETLKLQLQRRNAECPACPFVFFRGTRPLGNFRKAWDKACVEAELPGLLFHDLRRTAVRNLVRAGVPERVAMAVSGHRTRAMLDRYTIVSERDLNEAARKLDTYVTHRASSTAEVQPPASQSTELLQ